MIHYYQLNQEELDWLGFNSIETRYMLKAIGKNWFPTEILMGTINGKFHDTNNIGASVKGVGSMNITLTNIKKAIKLLTDKGYTCKKISNPSKG